jgi:alpha-L-fucosidase
MRVVSLLTFLLFVPHAFPAAVVHEGKNYATISPSDTKEEIIEKAACVVPSPQQYAWQKMEFIAFVHFGMNTFANVEWAKEKASTRLFNPTELDCDQWARVLKAAGMKMAILTAKHEDGFCLWPSKYTKYSVKYSPWKNGKGDVVREFVNACHKYDLKVGLYISPWDQAEPSYGTPKYNNYFESQLTELLTEYGPITEVWFDGGIAPDYPKKQAYDWHAYYKLVRKLQPNALIAIMGPDIRWVGTESGYGRETEWDVLPIDLTSLDSIKDEDPLHPIDAIYRPHNYMGSDLGGDDKLGSAKGLFWYPAETDVTIRPGWFYHAAEDSMVKSVAQLVDIYFGSVGRNSVLLLNVPPDKQGLINNHDIKALKGFYDVISKTFRDNLVSDAIVEIDGTHREEASALFGHGKYWISKNGTDTVALTFIMPQNRTFDVAMLQEKILVGQRIAKFRIEYWDGNGWQKMTEGTTVGYKRLLRFNPITTDRVRLVIEKSRLNPTLSKFSLFYLSPEYLNKKK